MNHVVGDLSSPAGIGGGDERKDILSDWLRVTGIALYSGQQGVSIVDA